MNGTQLWRAVRREFKKQYPIGTIHRVENTLENGMSDCVWCVPGRSGWIELKGDNDKETPLQRTFRKKWNEAGGDAVVLMTAGKGFDVLEYNGAEFYETLAEAMRIVWSRKRS